MDGLSTSLFVLMILAVVAVAAVAYTPTSFLGQWQKLAQKYETVNTPRSVTFPDEYIMFGKLFPWIPWKQDLAEYAKFDVELDEDGLWLLYDGPLPPKCPPRMFVPGNHIKYLRDKHELFFFLIHADPPVPMVTKRELGEAIKRKMTAPPAGMSFD
ncbi:MAG: hypothetical protein QNI99_17035 [Woeseiaceae bacterium]|nr:hypothetical protein [Woeseiaceae bacterium]